MSYEGGFTSGYGPSGSSDSSGDTGGGNFGSWGGDEGGGGGGGSWYDDPYGEYGNYTPPEPVNYEANIPENFNYDLGIDPDKMNSWDTPDDTDNTKETGFFTTPFGRFVKGVVGMNPLGRVGLAGYNMAKGNWGEGLSSLAGPLGSMAYGFARNPAGFAANTIGGGLGSGIGGSIGASLGIGGPLGATLGRYGMAQVMDNARTPGINPTGAGAPSLSGRAGDGSSMVAQGLGSLFGGQSAFENAGAAADRLTTNNDLLSSQYRAMPTLAEMYGPNSSYAMQLRKQLAARDAKAGRNSQYGAREAEFQAHLADKAANYGNMQSQALDRFNRGSNDNALAIAKAKAQQQQIRSQQLASLFDVGQRSGAFNWAGNQLSDLFSSGGGSSGPSDLGDFYG